MSKTKKYKGSRRYRKNKKSLRGGSNECSGKNFFNCNSNCKWSWKKNNLFGFCEENSMSEDYLESMTEKFDLLKKEIKTNKNKLRDLNKTYKNYLETLKTERNRVLIQLKKLSELNKQFDSKFEQINLDEERRELSEKQILNRNKYRILESKRDSIEIILRNAMSN